MLRKIISFAVVVVALAALSGCGLFQSKDDSSTSLGADFESLVQALRQSGAAVQTSGSTIEQPFFSVPGKELQINGHAVQIFEFPSEADASAEADHVPADGSTFETMIIDWISSPHFFRDGKLIALYVGENAQVLALLENILGEQFAGR